MCNGIQKLCRQYFRNCWRLSSSRIVGTSCFFFQRHPCKYDAPAMLHTRSSKWQTVSDIIRSETAIIMYKSLNVQVPECLSNLFVKNSTRNMRNLRNTENDLSLPLRKLKMGIRPYLFVIVSFGITWNLISSRPPLMPLLRKI